MATKTSEGKVKVTLDSSSFEKGARAVMDAANAMSSAIKAAMAAAGTAILAAMGAKTIGAVINSVKGIIELGEGMANAGKRAGIAAGQFYLFNAAVEKGLSMKTVAGLVGENAQVLDRSATVFRDVAIKLWAVGEKIRGFWLGLMDRVAPVLSRILDGSLGASLVSAGEWFGQKIADAVEVVYKLAKDGSLWSTLQLGLQIAFDYAGERLMWLGKLANEVLHTSFKHAFENGIKAAIGAVWAAVQNFAKSIGEGVKTAFLTVVAAITGLLNTFLIGIGKVLNLLGLETDEGFQSGKKQLNAETQAAWKKAGVAGEQAPQAPKDNGETFSDIIKNILGKNQFEESTGLQGDIKALLDSVASASKGYKADEKKDPTKSFENNTRRAAFGADSLASIGGGGGVFLGLSVLDVNKAQLNELKSIRQGIAALSPLGENSTLRTGSLTTPTLSRSQVQPSVGN